MIVNEILIRQSNPYDVILARLCEMVLEGRETMGREGGLVGAAVLDTAGNCVYATSSPEGEYWRHAERNAIDAYKQRYDVLDPDAVIITTLSPCCSAMQDRYGSSCEDMLNAAGIRHVYAGYDDYTQQRREPDFELTFTKNKKLQQLCGAISNTFLRDDTPDTIAELRLNTGRLYFEPQEIFDTNNEIYHLKTSANQYKLVIQHPDDHVLDIDLYAWDPENKDWTLDLDRKTLGQEQQYLQILSAVADVIQDQSNDSYVQQINLRSSDSKKQNIYDKLIKQNLRAMLPDFEHSAPGTLSRIKQ